MRPRGPPSIEPMPRESMTPRERWLAVFRRQKPDRVPMDYWATDETTAQLMRHLRLPRRSGRCSRNSMSISSSRSSPNTSAPRSRGSRTSSAAGSAGRLWDRAPTTNASYSPLAGFTSVDEIERNYPWPNPTGGTTVAPRPARGLGDVSRSGAAAPSLS